MIRAILAGTKTQTRRVCKHYGAMMSHFEHAGPSPYGGVGDTLWVRETWAIHFMFDDLSPAAAYAQHPDNRWYRADGDDALSDRGCPASGRRGKWRPSIHMPRAASRLTLRVTSVRVERLQEITDADAIAEGIVDARGTTTLHADEPLSSQLPHLAFRALWESLNAERAPWASNPFVWVIAFERIEENA
jgi:hypothetical protein